MYADVYNISGSNEKIDTLKPYLDSGAIILKDEFIFYEDYAFSTNEFYSSKDMSLDSFIESTNKEYYIQDTKNNCCYTAFYRDSLHIRPFDCGSIKEKNGKFFFLYDTINTTLIHVKDSGSYKIAMYSSRELIDDSYPDSIFLVLKKEDKIKFSLSKTVIFHGYDLLKVEYIYNEKATSNKGKIIPKRLVSIEKSLYQYTDETNKNINFILNQIRLNKKSNLF